MNTMKSESDKGFWPILLRWWIVVKDGWISSIPLFAIKCPRSPTGRGAGLRNQLVWIRIPPRVQNKNEICFLDFSRVKKIE